MKQFMLIALVAVAAATDAEAGPFRHRGRQVRYATCLSQPQAVGHYYVAAQGPQGPQAPMITPGQPTSVIVTPSPQSPQGPQRATFPRPGDRNSPALSVPDPTAIRNPYAHGTREHTVFEQGRAAGLTQGRERATGAVPPPNFPDTQPQ